MFRCKWSVISEHKACQHLAPFLFDWLKKMRHVCGHPVVYIRKKRLWGVWCFWVPLLPDLFLPRVCRNRCLFFLSVLRIETPSTMWTDGLDPVHHSCVCLPALPAFSVEQQLGELLLVHFWKVLQHTWWDEEHSWMEKSAVMASVEIRDYLKKTNKLLSE